MKYLALILALLLPSPASAGQAAKRMMLVMGNACNPAATINCIGSVSPGVPDTGTYTYPSTLTSATVSANASCTGNSGSANVHLVVDGVTQDYLSCGSGVSDSRTLTYTGSVSSVRIYGIKSGTGTYSASGFVIPR